MVVLNRNIAPSIQVISEIPLPAPHLIRLDNGIPLYVLPNAQIDLIHIIVGCRTGFLYERERHLTQFTYSLLKESPPHHTPDEMADLLAFNGARLGTEVAADYVTMTIVVPKAKFDRILPDIFECMTQPHYRSANLRLYRNLSIKNFEYNHCKTDFRANRWMLRAMLGKDHPAGRLPKKDDFKIITTSLMRDRHRETFCAGNIRLFAAGNLSRSMIDLIIDLFRQIPAGQTAEQLPEIPLPADETPEFYEEMPDCVQSTILLCRPLFGFTHPDRQDFSILNTLVGNYFGSRLMKRLREKDGYTYNISSNMLFFGQQSIFCINSDVNAENTRAAINACFDEIERLKHEPPSGEELQKVQHYALGRLLRNIDNTVSYLKEYCFWNRFDMDEREIQTQIRHIREITPKRIQELTKKYFERNKFTRIIVGKYQ